MIAAIYWACAFVVLAESLNKLERCKPLARMPLRDKLAEWFKVAAWMLLALGGAGALISPLFDFPPPTMQEIFTLAGFATLIVRTRIKEG